MPPEPTPASPNPAATPVLIGTLLVGAVLFAVLPGMLDLPDPIGLVLSVALYAVAAGDVGIALWLRSKLRKAQRSVGGAVQRR